jgi:hypothetical protein
MSGAKTVATTCGLCQRQVPVTDDYVRIAGTPVCASCQASDVEHVPFTATPISPTSPLESLLGMMVQQKHGDPTFNPRSRRLLLLIAGVSFVYGVVSLLLGLVE